MGSLRTCMVAGLVLGFLGASGVARGQSACSRLLTEMESLYASGSLLPIHERLRSCLATGEFSREERIRAQKLITLAHVFTDSVSLSEQSMVALLRVSPEYSFEPAVDPQEIFYLHAQYRTWPIFRLTAYAGANYAFANTLRPYGIENTNQVEENVVSSIRGHVGVAIERTLFSHVEASIGIRGVLRSLELSNQLFTYTDYTLMENQTSVDVPIILRVLLNDTRKLQPYLFGGWAVSFLLSANLSGARQGGTSVNLGTQDLLENNLRKRFSHYALAGLGARLRVHDKRDFVFVEAYYVRGLTNLSRSAERFQTSPDLIFRLGFIDDDFALDNISLNVGYVYSIYNPKKRRQYR